MFELFQWPLIVILPLAVLSSREVQIPAVAMSSILRATLVGVIYFTVLVGLPILLGLVVERVRFFLFARRHRVSQAPMEYQNRLQSICDDITSPLGFRFQADRVHSVLSDLSLGAQVQGVIFPRLILSGGTLVSLLRGEAKARSIVSHEMGHIYNGDAFLPGIVLMSFGYASLSALVLLLVYIPTLIEAAVHASAMTIFSLSTEDAFTLAQTLIDLLSLGIMPSFMLWYLIQRREYAADAVGIGLSGTRSAFLEAISTSHHAKWSFFHPTARARQNATSGISPVMRPSGFWLFCWLWMLNYSLLVLESGNYLYSYALLAVVLLGALSEFLRLTIGGFAISDEDQIRVSAIISSQKFVRISQFSSLAMICAGLVVGLAFSYGGGDSPLYCLAWWSELCRHSLETATLVDGGEVYHIAPWMIWVGALCLMSLWLFANVVKKMREYSIGSVLLVVGFLALVVWEMLCHIYEVVLVADGVYRAECQYLWLADCSTPQNGFQHFEILLFRVSTLPFLFWLGIGIFLLGAAMNAAKWSVQKHR